MSIIYKISLLALLFGLWQSVTSAQNQQSKAYPTGNYIFCGREIPRSFSYLVEKKTGASDWTPVAELKAPRNEAECMANIMQLPASIAAITPIEKPVISFIWNHIQKADVIDSLFAYAADPRYQFVAQTCWFDDGIKETGTYSYRIKKLTKNGKETVINEVSVKFPSTSLVSDIAPVRFSLSEKSISISYSIADVTGISGIKLYRSPYLKKKYDEVPVRLLYTKQKGDMVAVLIDQTATKGLTYSYVAQPYDALGNKGKLTDTLNIYFVAKQADIGLVTNLQVIPNPDKGGNQLKWDYNYNMNVNTIDVFRSTSYNGEYKMIAALNPRQKEYFDNRNINPAVTYFYYISINNGISHSLPSARVPAILEGRKTNSIPPQDLTATRKGNIVTLKFRRLANDTRGYQIYRGDGYVAPLLQLPRMVLSTDSLVSYSDTLPKTINSMVYSYAVASINSSYNISPKSNRVNITYSGGRLPVPDKVNAIMDNNNILVTWADAASIHAGIGAYRIFRETKFDDKIEKPEELIATTGFSNNSFTDKLLKPGRYYTYRIQCVGADTLDLGDLSQSTGILNNADAMLQPGNVSALSAEKKIVLQWNMPIDDNLTSALIYRSVENGQPVLLKEVEKTIEAFEDTSAEKQIRYFYFIVLKYADGQLSQPTDAVSAKWE